MPLEFDGVNGIVKNTTSDGDVTIKGNDGGSEISALTFDMSDQGTATFNHDIVLADDNIAKFGDSGELVIYHHNNGSSYIQETGGGDLQLLASNFKVMNAAGTENKIAATTDGAVELYHNNVVKIVTDAEGANLTGILDVSSKVVVAGGTEATTTSDGSIATAGGLSVTKDTVMGDDLKMLSDGAVIHFGADSEITLTHVHNTGLVINSGSGSNTLQLQSTDGGNSAGPILNLYRNSSSPADDDILGQLKHTGRNSNSEDVIYSSIITTTKTVTNGSENGLVDINVMSAGSLLEMAAFQGSVGTVFNESSNDLDFRIETNGNSKMFFVDGGNDAVIFNGNSSDYEASSQMVQIHNAGLHITSGYGIQGGVNADRAQIGLTSGSGGNVLFKVNNSEVARFTSGGLAIGGTGAANTLNDYEEGTYTPTVDDENGGSYGLSTNSDLLQYTKIGRLVTIQGMVSVTSESSPNGTLRLSLPFTAPSLTDDSDYVVASMAILNNGSTLAGETYLFVQPGSYAYLYNVSDAGGSNYIQHDEVDTNFQFHVNLSYVVS